MALLSGIFSNIFFSLIESGVNYKRKNVYGISPQGLVFTDNLEASFWLLCLIQKVIMTF
jgi:hypothetical protein